MVQLIKVKLLTINKKNYQPAPLITTIPIQILSQNMHSELSSILHKFIQIALKVDAYGTNFKDSAHNSPANNIS